MNYFIEAVLPKSIHVFFVFAQRFMGPLGRSLVVTAAAFTTSRESVPSFRRNCIRRSCIRRIFSDRSDRPLFSATVAIAHYFQLILSPLKRTTQAITKAKWRLLKNSGTCTNAQLSFCGGTSETAIKDFVHSCG